MVSSAYRRDMVIYEVPFSVFVGFGWMGTMLANFHMCGIMLLLRAVLNLLVRASKRTYMYYVHDV